VPSKKEDSEDPNVFESAAPLTGIPPSKRPKGNDEPSDTEEVLTIVEDEASSVKPTSNNTAVPEQAPEASTETVMENTEGAVAAPVAPAGTHSCIVCHGLCKRDLRYHLMSFQSV
jgi:hypothetical protein